MKSIILAASRGERLWELTKDIPKCMLEFGGETLLERQIRILGEYGIRASDIYVVAGYRIDVIRNIAGIHVIENQDYAVSDNSYSLWLALREIDDDVLVFDGDLVYEKDAICEIVRCTGNAVLATEEAVTYEGTGAAGDFSGRLLEIGKHISDEKSFAGVMHIKKEDAVILCAELAKSRTTWYTVALNNLLPDMAFQICTTENKIRGINTYFEYIDAKRKFGIEDFTIWVTGASGFLGGKILQILKRTYTVVGTKGSNADSELTATDHLDKNAVQAFVQLTKPRVIINTAGIPEPELCEADHQKAWQMNVQTVINLVDVCRAYKVKLIHISTDYVFDGDCAKCYQKEDERRPKNYYGETKKQAEDVVKTYGNSLIVRIPILYGYNGENDKPTFPSRLAAALSNGEKQNLDDTQIRYPVLIDDVAFAIKDALPKTGMIHITSSIPVTKYVWGKVIAKEYGFDEDLLVPVKNLNVQDRPLHVRLAADVEDYIVSDVHRGTEIMRKQSRCIFHLIYKSNPAEMVYGVRVGKYRYELGKNLGKSLPAEIVNKIDYVVPVPSSGLYYAMGVAKEIKVPYLQALIKNDTRARSFQIADISLREQMINQKILPIRELIEGKRIMLVDEAIFTGTTLRVVCDMVKACHAKEIYIALPTPICRNVCRQYVQPERRLLSQDINEKEIAEYFRVDGVFFQPYENFTQSIQGLKGICSECFDDAEL